MSDLPTGVSEDLKGSPFTLDRSSDFAKTMGGGPTPGEIAKATSESAAQQETLKKAGGELVKSIDEGNAMRHAAMLQKPPMPPPPPAPEQKNTNPVEAWGSLAMSMAMIGSAFTRRPLLNSLNAAADVMKAYQAKDASAYKTAFDKWKAESDYSLKLYEYQHESYKDALDMIATDQKGALARFNAVAAGLGDDPISQLAKSAKLPEIASTLQMRQDAHEKAVIERGHTLRKGEYEQAVTDGHAGMREAEKSGDPNMIAVARQNLNEAIQRSQEYHQAESTKAAPEPGSDNAILAQRYREFKADPTNAGREPSADQWQQWKGDLKKAESTSSGSPEAKFQADWEKENPKATLAEREAHFAALKQADRGSRQPVEIEAKGADGKPLYKGYATYDPTTRLYTPVGRTDPLPSSAVIGKPPPGSVGGRQAQQVTALRGAGNEAVKALANLVELPISANLGALMGTQFKTPDDMAAALRRSAAREFTSRDARRIDLSFAGVARSLGILENQGRASGVVGLSEQMTKLAPQSGDDPLLVMRAHAEIRQIIDAAMENARVSGMAGPEELALFDSIQKQADAAVPYTVHDVTVLERGMDGHRLKKESAQEFAKRVFANKAAAANAAGSAPSATPAPAGATPSPAAAPLPPGLPDTAGHVEGSTVEDKDGKTVAVLRGGKWVAP